MSQKNNRAKQGVILCRSWCRILINKKTIRYLMAAFPYIIVNYAEVKLNRQAKLP